MRRENSVYRQLGKTLTVVARFAWMSLGDATMRWVLAASKWRRYEFCMCAVQHPRNSYCVIHLLSSESTIPPENTVFHANSWVSITQMLCAIDNSWASGATRASNIPRRNSCMTFTGVSDVNATSRHAFIGSRRKNIQFQRQPNASLAILQLQRPSTRNLSDIANDCHGSWRQDPTSIPYNYSR